MKEEEYQRYGRNKQTLINNTYINSGNYRRKFDNLTDDNVVNRTIYEKTKKMLKHRSGTLLEDMCWIDSNTGEVVAEVTDSSVEERIEYTKAVQKILHEELNLIAVHTHPGSMPPSVPDLNSCFIRKYSFGIVACHDGKIFTYKSKRLIPEWIASTYIAEFRSNGYSEYEAQLKALEKFAKQGVIEFREVLS